MRALRLGVFGGTFNPIHLGHLHLARRAKRLLKLDEIHFVVATSPPHKPLEALVPLIHRYAMVSLAIAGTSSFIPSLMELDPPSSPFSLHTMEKYAVRHQGESADLFFIAGGDSLREVAGWHKSEELLRSYNFIFVARPGISAGSADEIFPPGIRERIVDLRNMGPERLMKRLHEEQASGEPRILLIEAGAPDISSSVIRRLAAAGKPIGHLLPVPVYRYIHKLHLYGER